MDYILSSLDMFANITENLIDYTFNVRLCLATCGFSSLRFLADDVV